MSLNIKVSNNLKNFEHFPTIWIPTQRTLTRVYLNERSPTRKKIVIEKFMKELNSVVTRKNSLNLLKVQYK